MQGVDVFTEVMILSDPGKELDNQENRINKLDIEGSSFTPLTCSPGHTVD